MPWARLDDSFYDHPKTLALAGRSPAAGFLHVRAITYCCKHLTDGFFPKSLVETLVPVQRDRDEQLAALIEIGLWYDRGEQYAIHDFQDYQPTKDEVAEKRRKDRERKRQERQAA
jgi:hypothetical protein